MPRFLYTAVDAQGQSLTGEVDGSSLAVVRDALRQQGLRIQEVLPAPSPGGALSATDATAILQQIGQAAQAELPLVGSLRAFSEEVISPRLRRQLGNVCDALEAGESLEKVLADPNLRLPRSVSSIMNSGLPHAAINHLLSLSVRSAATSADLRARAFLLLTYPALILTTILGFWAFLIIFVTHQFGKIYEDFGTEISPLLVQMISLSRVFREWNWWGFLVLIPVVVLLILGYRFGLSAMTRQRIWCRLPIIGSMYRLVALSQLAKLLAVMLESRVPLPQALTWSALGVNDADLTDRCIALTERLKMGEDAVTATERVPGLPAHMEQMMRFAAHGAEGGAPLRAMGQLLEYRAKALSQMAMPLMEPVLEIAAVISIFAYVLLVFPPLIKLLNDLS